MGGDFNPSPQDDPFAAVMKATMAPPARAGQTAPAQTSSPLQNTATGSFDPTKSYGTPPQILDNLRGVESSGDALAVNKDSGAMGQYQFMPSTVAALRRQGVKFDPFDPDQSRAAADYYLSSLTAKNGGDMRKGLAAYGGFTTKDPTDYVNRIVGPNSGPTSAANAPDVPQGQDDPFTAVIKATMSPPARVAAVSSSGRPGTSVATASPAAPLAPSSQPVSNVSATSAGILGGAKGAFDTLIGGPAQLIAHGVASGARALGASPTDSVLGTLDQSVDDATKSRQQIFDDITQGHDTAAGVGEAIGGGAAALALPVGRVGEGAGLVTRLLNAGKVGAVAGAAQPVVDSDNYWGRKAAQTVLGGATGVVAQPVAELGAKAIGGATNGVVNAVKNVANRFADNAVPDIAANASPELQQAVKAAQASGQTIDPVALGRQVEADSLPVKMSLTPGQASGNPTTISTEMNNRSLAPERVAKLNDQNTQLVQNLNAIRNQVAPDATATDHIIAGQTGIDALAAKNQAMENATKTAYKTLEDANGGSLPLDGQSFANAANSALGQNMKGAFLPREIQGILTKFQTGERPMTFENFENLRTILGNEARSNSNGNVVGAVNTVRDTLENMPMTADTEEIKPLADAARGAAKAHFDMLNSTPSLKAVDNGTATPDDFIQKYVVNAKRGSLINTVQAMGDDPTALQTMKAGVVNYLKAKAGILDDQGNFSQDGYNKAFAALKPKLDVLFDADEAKQLQTVGNVARYTQAQPRGSFVNNSNTDVSNLARTAGPLLAHGVNAATGSPLGSIGSFIGNTMSKSAAEKTSAVQLKDLLSVGAGIGKTPASQTFLKDVLPPYAGRVATLPLAKLSADQVK